MVRFYWIAGGLLLLGGRAAHAQLVPTAADSALLLAAVQQVAQRYAATTQSEAHLLSGTEHIEHRKSYLTGSPYYPNDDLQVGSVVYDGFAFTNVPLRYDSRAGQVIFYPGSRPVILQLVSQKLTSFTAGNHEFVRIETDSVANPQVRSGFYDLLADGAVRLLARRTKRVSEQLTPTGPVGSYYEVNTYFVEQGSTYTEVNRLRDVTRLFPAQRVALQRFARTHRLLFREASRELSLALLLNYYNTLAAR